MNLVHLFVPLIVTLLFSFLIHLLSSWVPQRTKFHAPDEITLIPRTKWGAKPPKTRALALRPKAPFLLISETSTRNCSTFETCAPILRQIQDYHLQKFFDLSYNFVIGGDGAIYEGRGWGVQGAHSYGYNDKSLGVAFIGRFGDQRPPVAQSAACKGLIQYGITAGFIANDYKILAEEGILTMPGLKTGLLELIMEWGT